MASSEQAAEQDSIMEVYNRRKILVAVDESEESMNALTWAIEHLIILPSSEDKRNSDLIVVLHVQGLPHMAVGLAGPGYPLEDFYFEPEILETLKRSQEEISRKVLERAKQICAEKNLDIETRVVYGDARDAICENVNNLQPTFLVVGSHGYGALKRTLLGSVSDYCAHNAKCPVVIVKRK